MPSAKQITQVAAILAGPHPKGGSAIWPHPLTSLHVTSKSLADAPKASLTAHAPG